MNLLVIETSPRGPASASKDVARFLVDKLKHTHTNIVVRDLAIEPLPHINGEMVEAMFMPPEQQTALHQSLLAKSDEVVAEVEAADVIVIATPMWNFGLPSVLKAWIDHLVRAGKTFRFSEKGLQGAFDARKKVYFILSSGSRYTSGPFAAFDAAVPSLKSALGFIGLTNIEVIRVEGTNDPASRDAAIIEAKAVVEKVIA